MKFSRIALRQLPSGENACVYPFYVYTKGPEDKYRWPSFKAIFQSGEPGENLRKVSGMAIREVRRLLLTHEDFKDVGWMILEDGVLDFTRSLD